MASTRDHPTIKALVLEFVHRCAGSVDYDALTREVRKHFPSSRWQRSHWAWYRWQIRRGRFKALFSEAERAALSHTRWRRAGAAAPVPRSRDDTALLRGPRARDAEIKRIGDALLSHVRLVISLAAGDDIDKRFKLNRWVFSRLLQDEVRVKRPIKRLLWDRGVRSCHACGKAFASLKGVELHRKNEAQGYLPDNCVLICRDCHQETA